MTKLFYLFLGLLSLGLANAQTLETLPAPYNHPLDDSGCTLQWYVYTPSGSGPWPAAVLFHGGGFDSNNPLSSPGQRACAAELQANGFIVFSPYYRLVLPVILVEDRVPGQTTPGTWNSNGGVLHSDQTVDVKNILHAARIDSRCNGHMVALGGSGGATHVISAAIEHETSTGAPGVAQWGPADRPDGVIGMSIDVDFGDRTDPGYETLNYFASVSNKYCASTDTTYQTSLSPVAKVDNQAKPMLLVFYQQDNMPYPQLGIFTARLDALGVTNYQTITLPGAGHTWGCWAPIHTQGLAFLNAVIAGSTPPPPTTAALVNLKRH